MPALPLLQAFLNGPVAACYWAPVGTTVAIDIAEAEAAM